MASTACLRGIEPPTKANSVAWVNMLATGQLPFSVLLSLTSVTCTITIPSWAGSTSIRVPGAVLELSRTEVGERSPAEAKQGRWHSEPTYGDGEMDGVENFGLILKTR